MKKNTMIESYCVSSGTCISSGDSEMTISRWTKKAIIQCAWRKTQNAEEMDALLSIYGYKYGDMGYQILCGMATTSFKKLQEDALVESGCYGGRQFYKLKDLPELFELYSNAFHKEKKIQ